MQVLPNSFIIGAQKAGTTSLFDWLGQHPMIYAPQEAKDFHFFSRNDHFEKGHSHLAARYAGYADEPIIMNAGVNYVFHKTSIQRIYDYNPKAKLILVLRDPITRAFSAHGFMYKLGLDTISDFDKAIKRELEGGLSSSNSDQSNLTYLAHGLYGEQLKNCLDIFPKDQILVLFFEKMVKAPHEHLAQIFDFLGVDTNFEVQLNRINQTGTAKSRGLNKLVYGDSFLKSTMKFFGLHRLLPRQLINKARIGIREMNTSKEKEQRISENQYASLKDYYRDDLNLLQSLLDQDLTNIWPSIFQKQS